MRITQAQLVSICERASTLRERLSADFVPDERNPPDDELVSRRLERWCRNVAGGDRARFEFRLAADGWDLERARRALGPVRLAPGAALPAWVETLAAIIDMVDAQQSPPDEGLFGPFVAHARDCLAETAGTRRALLADDAMRQMEMFLVRRLSEAASPTLALRFDAFRAVRDPLAAAPLAHDADHPACRQFQDSMLRGEWVRLLCDFPRLARLLATLVDSWVDFVGSFLLCLDRDLPAIRKVFGPGDRAAIVVDLQAGLSDPHRGGRTVVRVVFDSGLRLLCKPKDLEMERAWYGLLGWINAHGFSPPFTLPKVLSRGDHGWMEWVEARSDVDADSYHYVGGALLCLLYVLGGTDFLRDNVVACEAQPVLVDLETLMQPHVRLDGPDVSRRVRDCVLGTRLLPEWVFGANGELRWVGGLDRALGDAWCHHDLTHGERVVEGFARMYGFLLEHRPALMAPQGPLHAFAGVRTRPIFQDTSVYERLSRRSLQADVLRDGVERSLLLERLYRLPVPTAALGRFVPRCCDEIRAIERLDVPWFAASTTGTALHLESSGSLATHFTEAPLERAFEAVRRLNSDDLQRQIALIRGSFCMRAAVVGGGAGGAPAGKEFPREADSDATRHAEESSAAVLTRSAMRIFADIAAAAVYTRDGVTWPVPERVQAGGTFAYRFAPSGVFLYCGNSGIALFLAAVSHVPGGEAAGDLAREALDRVLLFVNSPVPFARVTLGAATGLSSLAYGLLKAGMLLDDRAVQEAALKAAHAITDERVAADSRLDVFDGAAGAILALLAVHDVTGEPDLVRRAVTCGEHLLAARTQSPSGRLAWRTIGGRYVSGMAHGMAGVAYALLRLFRATGHEPFLLAATDAMAFEAEVFSADRGNWRAFGSPADEPVFRNALCHGAAGIGLARIGGLPALDTPAVRGEIADAARATAADDPAIVDSLCCGNTGRIVFLSEAGFALMDPVLLRAARALATRVADTARSSGSFNLHPDLHRSVDNPGFFRGTAGIGYEFLRLALPGRFPCVSLWL